MITEPKQLQQLRFRTDLPKLSKEGFSVFAQLEGDEQKLVEAERVRLFAGAYAAQVAAEEAMSERPLPALVAKAYRVADDVTLPEGFVEYVVAFDLAAPFERRKRSGEVIAVTHHVRARVRVFSGAFAYSTPDDSTPLAELDTTSFTAL